MNKRIYLYDTTLRDGTQAEEVSFSLDDKLRITEALDDFGVSYVEGGYPGSNPRDVAYFEAVRKLTLKKTRIAAFGSTHHPKNRPGADPGLKGLLDAGTPVVTLFGKCWDMHAKEVLRVPLKRNLELIHDTIAFTAKRVDEVIFDAEHFFDGFRANPDYAMAALHAAEQGGATVLCLCETNGGMLPFDIEEIVAVVKKSLPKTTIGIHCHNDSDAAVANSLTAIRAGATHAQGTINGIGERCGNANLLSIAANLETKLGRRTVGARNLKKAKKVSRLVSELANMAERPHQPFVGKSAFAHKGGMHVSAVRKVAASYEHIDPARVGNERRILVSDLSGRGNILSKAEQFGIDLKANDDDTRAILARLKEQECQGFIFEGADASFELLMRKERGEWPRLFSVERARVVSNFSDLRGDNWAEAVIKLKMTDGSITHAVAEGNGPVNALDKAIRQSLMQYYPQVADVQLHDFKVRLIDEGAKTAAITRVLIESGDASGRWATVGVSANVIEAAWKALLDSLEYKLYKSRGRTKR